MRVRVGGLAYLALLSNHDLLFFDFATNSMPISVTHLPPLHAVHHRPLVYGPSCSRLDSMREQMRRNKVTAYRYPSIKR